MNTHNDTHLSFFHRSLGSFNPAYSHSMTSIAEAQADDEQSSQSKGKVFLNHIEL